MPLTDEWRSAQRRRQQLHEFVPLAQRSTLENPSAIGGERSSDSGGAPVMEIGTLLRDARTTDAFIELISGAGKMREIMRSAATWEIVAMWRQARYEEEEAKSAWVGDSKWRALSRMVVRVHGVERQT